MPGVQLITGPTVEPLELDELKDHLRITDSTPEHDRDLGRKLLAARRWVESRTGRALLAQVWDYWFDAWPATYYLEIPKAPIISVDSLSSYTTANVATVFLAASYVGDVFRGRVLLNDTYDWPTEVRRYHAGVVRFTAGYGTSPDSVPEDLIEAVAEMAGYLYYDREGTEPTPQKVMDIIAAYELVTA